MKKNIKIDTITIGNRKYHLHLIKWKDIVGDSGHAEINEFHKMTPSIIITLAYIFKKDKNNVYTFSSYAENEETFSDRNIIPTKLITEIKRI